jgi:predicted RNA binding protein YcfA (HicA-like mRNA interferase family)
MPSDRRYSEVRKLLEAKGYHLHRVTGSHHQFKNGLGGRFTVPVHHGKVTPVYVRQIQKL